MVASPQQKTGGPAFTALSCQKNIVQPEVAVAEAAGAHLDVNLNIPLDSFAILLTIHGLTHLEWSYHPISPPMDLVLVLQHFVI